ncbi:uncharacterized protein LOC124973799 [Sciurus carolinensis]|uniref:uncharacterized protein LOC124973799 n=1 Tax=Sciurus carolinensis TaxID=30640 RepID=UPI001FB453C4|nr:uncharacterized protein LOC124973799 [Sciurus carolinensis]
MWLKPKEVLVKNPEALGGPEEQRLLDATAAPRAQRGDWPPQRPLRRLLQAGGWDPETREAPLQPAGLRGARGAADAAWTAGRAPRAARGGAGAWLRGVRRERSSCCACGSASTGHPRACVSVQPLSAASSRASWATCGPGPSYGYVNRGTRRKGKKLQEVLLKDALKLWVTKRSSCSFILEQRGGRLVSYKGKRNKFMVQSPSSH